jgi:hypothetical protein
MNQPEMMALDAADGSEHYTALVQVTPDAVVFNLGFTFKFDRESVRQVCERLLVLLGPSEPTEQPSCRRYKELT